MIMDASQFYVRLNKFLNCGASGRREVITKRAIRKEMDEILDSEYTESKHNFIEVDKYKQASIYFDENTDKYFVINKMFDTKESAKEYIEGLSRKLKR
jgi:hypothetical protein